MRTLPFTLVVLAVAWAPGAALAQPMLVVLEPAADSDELVDDAVGAGEALHAGARAVEDFRFVDVGVSQEAALELVNCSRASMACLRAVAESFDAHALVTGNVVISDGAPAIVLRSIVDSEPGRSEIMELPLDPEAVADWLAFELSSPPEVAADSRHAWKNPLGVSLLAAASGLLTTTLGLSVWRGNLNDDEFFSYREQVGAGLTAMGASSAEVVNADVCQYASAGESFGGGDALLSHAQSVCGQARALGVAQLVTLGLGLAAGVAGAVTLIAVSDSDDDDDDDVSVAFDVTPTDARVNARLAF